MSGAPIDNPFPSAAVVPESGVRMADFQGSSWNAAGKLVEVYRENYFSPKPTPGLVMGIRGRFGSGKTHLAFQLRDAFAQKPLVTRTLYEKLDHPNFLELYRAVAPKIFELLDTVIARHLAKLLRINTTSEPGAETASKIALRVVDETLAASPEHVRELVEQDLLPVSGLTRALDSEIEDASSDLTRDFFRAYAKFRDPSWSKIALRWFGAGELTPAERDDLGLHTAQIASPDQARKAMRFLLEVHRKADVPVFLCIDELERFVVRGAADDRRSFPGFLKDLAEMFENTGSFLVFCGAEDAWRQLTSDTFDRIKRERIVEVKLTATEARALLEKYCEGVKSNLAAVFEPGVVEFLIDLGENNARRLLSISHEGFKLAEKRKISQQDVREAASKALAGDQRFSAMDEAIQRVARVGSLSFIRGAVVSGATADYALNESSDQPIFLVVMRSAFRTDEVGAGRSVVDRLEKIKTTRPGARTAVIVLGYSTALVREQLQRIAGEILVYDEDRFETQLGDFVRSSPAPAANLEAQNALLGQVNQRLDEIDERRGADYKNLVDQIQAMETALRKQSAREREERVTDKIAETIEELQELSKKEETLIGSALLKAEPNHPIPNENAVLQILDDERTVLSRLELLNDGLPESSTFVPLIKVMTDAINDWEKTLRDASLDQATVRERHRIWRQLLRDFELRHQRRVRRELNILGWRVSSRYLGLAVLSLVGIVFDISVLTIGIAANRNIIANYYGWIVEARSALSVGATSSTPISNVRSELDKSFLSAKAEGLPVSQLNSATKTLLDSLDPKPGFSGTSVTDGVRAADELLARRPSLLWLTVVASWGWLVIGLTPAASALWIAWRLRNRRPTARGS